MSGTGRWGAITIKSPRPGKVEISYRGDLNKRELVLGCALAIERALGAEEKPLRDIFDFTPREVP